MLIVALLATMLLSLTACSAPKNQLDTPTERFFVNDYADILTDSDDDIIYAQGVELQEKTTAQAVVVTVDSLNGDTIEDLALELGRSWGIGDKDKDNGIVILLSETDREVYIAVGYGLEGALPDSKVGRIIDVYGIPYFSNDNFSTGLVSVYNAVVNEIYIEYGIETGENYVPIDQMPQDDDDELSEIIMCWIYLLIIIIVATKIFGRRAGAHIYFGHGGFGGSSGGFGGGSSFRGGGGSFGGGGSGRSF